MSGEVTEEAKRIQERLKEDPAITGRGLLLTYWCTKPIIAAVNGQCMGGGCEMLQSTDIRIAEEHATFAVPEVKRGLIAGAGSTMRLKRQIPYAVAMDMLLTGRVLNAQEALQWGLVSHVVPSGQSMAKAREIAEVICANGPLAVAAAKASVIETGWLPEAEAQPIEISHVIPVMTLRGRQGGHARLRREAHPRIQGPLTRRERPHSARAHRHHRLRRPRRARRRSGPSRCSGARPRPAPTSTSASPGAPTSPRSSARSASRSHPRSCSPRARPRSSSCPAAAGPAAPSTARGARSSGATGCRLLAAAADTGALMASVCTGAMLLAHAGVIGGRTATTHHVALDDLAATGADVVDRPGGATPAT